jgi:transcriptional regulator with XRE-family HTH domain
MNQVKIGKFIAECRRGKNLTQLQLAEKMNVTDRAVSKWETGKALPDSSIMLDLCKVLGITVNDLLSGEVVTVENYDKELEKNLIEVVKQKERSDRQLLTLEIVVGCICIAIMLALCMIAAFANIADWLRIVLIVIGLIPILVAMPFLIRIEQTAGYYECRECGNRYIPEFKSVFISMHMGRTRYMRCPKCEKLSWQKKVISKDKE